MVYSIEDYFRIPTEGGPKEDAPAPLGRLDHREEEDNDTQSARQRICIQNQNMTFMPFPKTPRLFREISITEKIDGTNAQVYIVKPEVALCNFKDYSVRVDDTLIYAGSRNRWITPQNDNHGFAKWVCEHGEELIKLGSGRHFGEWWGSGIQRGYGLAKGEKRFSLFNTIRWCRHGECPGLIPTGDPRNDKFQDVLPECVGLVPVLYRGPMDTDAVKFSLEVLRACGSLAAPGYNNPEGIIVFHTAANQGFKVTLDNDEQPKSRAHPAP